ncbi:MAG: hypothetical protein ACYC7E_15790 [Armatimonadota bacterium]
MSYPEPTTWTIHAAARKPAKAAVAVLIILVALLAVNALGGTWVHLVLAALLLVGSIAEFLFPVTYTLDAAGAHSRHLGSHRVVPWERVRRVSLRPRGVKISPLPAPGWAEAYRGVLLRTVERDTIVRDVHAWLESVGSDAETVEEE